MKRPAWESRLTARLSPRWQALYERYRVYIWYALVGCLTTAVNYLLYFALKPFIGYLLANVAAWVGSVIVAFYTNKWWVFESESRNEQQTVREFVGFAGSRAISGLIETVLLWLTVDVLTWGENLWKLIISILVVILNYFFSRFLVFKK